MGIGVLRGSKCSCEDNTPVSSTEPTPPNPNPRNFSIIRSATVGDYTIVMIKYHDCTNYEGKKILVFEKRYVSAESLGEFKFIDPHFCEGQHLSPIARFEPTVRGWEMARRFALAMEMTAKLGWMK